MGGAAPGPSLTVLVSEGCPGCARAAWLVAELRSRRPDVRATLVDVDVLGPGDLPGGVVGTPTWVLDGRPRWLGNPSLSELLRALVPAQAPTPSLTAPPRPVPARPVPARPVPARPVPARPVPARPVPARPVPEEIP